MKRWKGLWLIGVAAIHTVFAVVVFGDVLLSIIRRGVFDTVGRDPMTGAVVWFLFFGFLLFIAGLAIAALEAHPSASSQRPIGWSLFVMALLGIVLMPASGLWLGFPPAVAMMFAGRRGTGA